MSGIGSVVVPQVQVPNYSGLGAIVAQAGNAPSPLEGLVRGLEVGQNMRIKNQQMDIERQKIELMKSKMQQENTKESLLSKGAALKQYQETKEMMSNQAFHISRLPKDQQEGAYKLATLDMVKAGVILPEEVPDWSKGGSDLVTRLAVESPLGREVAKEDIVKEKYKADLELTKARTSVENIKLTPEGRTTKPLSAEAAKIVGLTESGMKGITELRNLMSTASTGDLASGTYLPTLLQGQKAQDYDRLRTTLSETLGRINSGGAINKDEEARFLKMMPKWSDSEATKMRKIDQLEAQIATVNSKVLGPSARPSGDDHLISEYQAQFPGATAEQIRAALQRKNSQRQG